MIKKLAVVSLFLVLYNALIAQEADSLFMLQAKNRVKYKVAGIRVEGASATDQNVIILFSGLIKGKRSLFPVIARAMLLKNFGSKVFSKMFSFMVRTPATARSLWSSAL